MCETRSLGILLFRSSYEVKTIRTSRLPDRKGFMHIWNLKSCFQHMYLPTIYLPKTFGTLGILKGYLWYLSQGRSLGVWVTDSSWERHRERPAQLPPLLEKHRSLRRKAHQESSQEINSQWRYCSPLDLHFSRESLNFFSLKKKTTNSRLRSHGGENP